MRAYKAAVPVAASELTKSVVRVIHKDLVTVTPVDESTALSNWQVATQQPLFLFLPAYEVGSHGSTKEESAQLAILQAEQALDNKQPGDTVYITNAAPYIRRLNDGYSKQEPAGFVERAKLLGRKTVNKLGLRLDKYV